MTNPQAYSRAVLHGRRPGRTSVLLIIGLVVAGLCLLVGLLLYVLSAGIFGTAVTFFLALPTAALYIGLALWLDRLEPEPKLVLLFIFLWGAGTATLFAGIGNSLNQALIFVPLFGMDWGGFLTAVISAPLVEESLKGLPLLFLLWRRKQEIDGRTWQHYTGGRYDALVLKDEDATTLVTGTASFTRLAEMAKSL